VKPGDLVASDPQLREDLLEMLEPNVLVSSGIPFEPSDVGVVLELITSSWGTEYLKIFTPRGTGWVGENWCRKVER
jgi:hypothetical protein